MSRVIKLTINNKQYLANQGQTILDVALQEGIEIPHLCKHPDLNIKGNCRICLVEVEGKGIVTSCSTQVENNMKIKTETYKIQRARKINLELIFAQHEEKCDECIYQDNCIILNYAKKYDLKITRFNDRKKKYPIWQFGDAIQFDASKCIDCRNCVEICKEKQTCDFYEVAERGIETTVKPVGPPNKQTPQTTTGSLDSSSLRSSSLGIKSVDCTYCGQCVVHCPVGAISGKPHWQEVEKLLEKPQGKILVAQIAPSIRTSIGEEFNQKPGKIVTGQLAASIKKIGFDYAFDVNLGADLTTYEEARELVHWLTSSKKRPMFTSCCPGWVDFVKFYYPEFISHLTSTNSPIMCSGPVLKTFFADKIKKDPRDIINVMIAPCTAKKHEAGLIKHQVDLGWCIERLDIPNVKKCICKDRSNLKGIKVPAVDYVLTTREYAYLLHKHKIDLPKLKPVELDKPLGIYSGAAAIYGASGGVMESALRSADYFFRVFDEVGNLDPVLKGVAYPPPLLAPSTLSPLQKKSRSELRRTGSKISKSRIEFKEVRGMAGIKSAKINIAGRKLNVAVINGLGNARKFLEDLKANKVEYDYVEIMACPGGCIGGGGQPVPVSAEIRAKRAAALYTIDKNLPIRTAHENPSILEIYNKYFKGEECLIEDVLHSKFEVKEREGYFIKE